MASNVKKVEVLIENLGPKLYQRGDVTDDPDILRLIDDPRGLVREAPATADVIRRKEAAIAS